MALHHTDKHWIIERITRFQAEEIRLVAREFYNPELLAEMRAEVLNRVLQDDDLIRLVRALARDVAEDAAREYVMHIIGATVKVKIARSWSPKRRKTRKNAVEQLPKNTGPV